METGSALAWEEVCLFDPVCPFDVCEFPITLKIRPIASPSPARTSPTLGSVWRVRGSGARREVLAQPASGVKQVIPLRPAGAGASLLPAGYHLRKQHWGRSLRSGPARAHLGGPRGRVYAGEGSGRREPPPEPRRARSRRPHQARGATASAAARPGRGAQGTPRSRRRCIFRRARLLLLLPPPRPPAPQPLPRPPPAPAPRPARTALKSPSPAGRAVPASLLARRCCPLPAGLRAEEAARFGAGSVGLGAADGWGPGRGEPSRGALLEPSARERFYLRLWGRAARDLALPVPGAWPRPRPRSPAPDGAVDAELGSRRLSASGCLRIRLAVLSAPSAPPRRETWTHTHPTHSRSRLPWRRVETDVGFAQELENSPRSANTRLPLLKASRSPPTTHICHWRGRRRPRPGSSIAGQTELPVRAPELPEKLTWAQVKIAAVAQKWPGSSKEKRNRLLPKGEEFDSRGCCLPRFPLSLAPQKRPEGDRPDAGGQRASREPTSSCRKHSRVAC
ncbi:synaptojanin-1 [Piliocolobus tephrosceles]|uniref:synaptojanin-1 n=1 Tax=Piliocolobus tephrosceles TaxID=591936 RepID=UPI000E6B17D7|nr:synaptojanin-1 [Piliocolobus tephrosceles]